MKRIACALFLLLATTLSAQDAKLQSKVFEVHHRDPATIADAVKMLGSGMGLAGISVNRDLGTITVRDFPENLATIGAAIERLDRAPERTADIALRISTLIAAKSALDAAEIPEELAPVVKQLQSTLRYTHYGLLASSVLRSKPDNGVVEGSGVADPALFGSAVKPGNPIVYSYRLRRISATAGEKPSVDIENFAFNVKIPIVTAGGVNYQPVGFDTPVSIRQNEKVVIGTTTLGDKALIVVVTATVE
jgi:hypothetical protein